MLENPEEEVTSLKQVGFVDCATDRNANLTPNLLNLFIAEASAEIQAGCALGDTATRKITAIATEISYLETKASHFAVASENERTKKKFTKITKHKTV